MLSAHTLLFIFCSCRQHEVVFQRFAPAEGKPAYYVNGLGKSVRMDSRLPVLVVSPKSMPKLDLYFAIKEGGAGVYACLVFRDAWRLIFLMQHLSHR
jgi:hypothetical protein